MKGFWEDEFLKMGSLTETGEVSTKELFSGKYFKLGARGWGKPAYRSSRGKTSTGLTPVYFYHTYVSDRRWTPPPAVEGRQWVYPRHGEVKMVRELGGQRDRKHRCWYVSSGTTVPKNLTWSGNAQPVGARGYGKNGVTAPTGAVAWQDYIDRADLIDESDRRREILCDADGEISFGTLGNTREERADFWRAVSEFEGPNRRIQSRITGELWCEQTPEAHREVVERFTNIFRERNLPFWAVVHLPHIEDGADPRNIHFHIVYHDRAAQVAPAGISLGSGSGYDTPDITGEDGRSGGKGGSKPPVITDIPQSIQNSPADGTGASPSWVFAKKKDRDARGPEWVTALRDRYCEIASEVQRREAARDGMEPSMIYAPGSYRDLGIDKPVCEHLGGRRMALERAGIPTKAGMRNAQREFAWQFLKLLGEEDDRASLRDRDIGDLLKERADIDQRLQGLSETELQAIRPALQRWWSISGDGLEAAARFDEAVMAEKKNDLQDDVFLARPVLMRQWTERQLRNGKAASRTRDSGSAILAHLVAGSPVGASSAGEAPARPQPRFSSPKKDDGEKPPLAPKPSQMLLGSQKIDEHDLGNIIDATRRIEERLRRRLNSAAASVIDPSAGVSVPPGGAHSGDLHFGEEAKTRPSDRPQSIDAGLPAQDGRPARPQPRHQKKSSATGATSAAGGQVDARQSDQVSPAPLPHQAPGQADLENGKAPQASPPALPLILAPPRSDDIVLLERTVFERLREREDAREVLENEIQDALRAAEIRIRITEWYDLAQRPVAGRTSAADRSSMADQTIGRDALVKAAEQSRRAARQRQDLHELGNDILMDEVMLALMALPGPSTKPLGSGLAGSGEHDTPTKSALLGALDHVFAGRPEDEKWKELDSRQQLDFAYLSRTAAIAMEQAQRRGMEVERRPDDRTPENNATRQARLTALRDWFLARPDSWVRARAEGLPIDDWQATRRRQLQQERTRNRERGQEI